MTRPVAVLRPQPGNARTAAAIEALGLVAIRLPLFAVAPVDWTAPDPADHDALILTSANAVRHAGGELGRLAGLPVHAVGQESAAAASAAGLRVVAIGAGDASDLAMLAVRAGVRRALHLAGREHRPLPSPPVTRTIATYASDPVAVAAAHVAALGGSVAMLHSPRAAGRLAQLLPPGRRGDVAIAAISARAAAAAGDGWAAVAIAARPDDTALIDAAVALAD